MRGVSDAKSVGTGQGRRDFGGGQVHRAKVQPRQQPGERAGFLLGSIA
jgi:hypothetical protein